MFPPTSIAAIVLCGGRSIRMGQNKASLRLNGETFLSRICRVVGSVTSPVVVVSSEKQTLPSVPDSVIVVPDLWNDEGPLAGLLTGLEYLAEHSPQSRIVWLGSCDAPLANAQVVTHLSQTPGTWDAAVVASGGHLQPFNGVYRTSVCGNLQALFDSGERRLSALTQVIDVATIDAEALRHLDPELDFLRNVNTPEDYDTLRRK